MEAFVAAAQRHLAAYKLKHLEIRENGTWGRPPRQYSHILPYRFRKANIILTASADFWRLQGERKWLLHRYFHHLSSSQALAFNLFLPLVARWSGAEVLLRALGIPEGPHIETDFEVILNSQEGTNIDVLITVGPRMRYIIEVKFTESAFGSTKADKRHIDKLRNVYVPLLQGRVSDQCLEPARFFREYQLLRSLSLIRPDTEDALILLLPRRHARIWRYASRWSSDLTLGPMGRSVRVVALENVLSCLSTAQAALPAPLQHYVEELVCKYSVPPAG